MYRIFIFSILALCFSTNEAECYNKLQFRQITSEDGLSQSWVRAIVQDSLGYIWIATDDGLNRYNGHEFKIYRHHQKDSSSLGNNSIYSVLVETGEKMWVGTDNGVYIYHNVTDSFSAFNRIPHLRVNKIFKDSKARFWFCTLEGLYLVLPDGNVRHFEHEAGNTQSLSHNYVRSIYEDSKGRIWVGTQNGLNLWVGGDNFSVIKASEETGLLGNEIWKVIEDDKGNLWVGTAQGGISILPAHRNNLKQIKFNPFFKASSLDLHFNSKEELWVACGAGEGLYVIDLQEYEKTGRLKYSHYLNTPFDETSLTDNTVITIFSDKNKDIWLGTFGGGANYYSPRAKPFQIFQPGPDKDYSLSDNLVNCLFEDDQYLWIGLEMGLDRLDKKTGIYKHYKSAENNTRTLGANAVYDIYKDSNNDLWIGTWAGGLNLYNPKRDNFTRFLPDEEEGSISNPHVFSIEEDDRGYLWVGTMGGGLNRFDSESKDFTVFRHSSEDSSSIGHDAVNDILHTKSGELYLSIVHALAKFDYATETFTHFYHDKNDSLSHNGGYILSIFEDSKGNLWLGTSLGLELFDMERETFYTYDISHGLPNNTIQAIEEDRHGNLWISTNAGISKFVDAINYPANCEIINYSMADGLPSNEFKKRASFYSPEEDILYFGSSQGYVVFSPDSIRINPIPPKTIISAFRPLSQGKKVRRSIKEDISYFNKYTVSLDYSQSDFEIHFASLNYLDPVKNRFRYKLEGYEENWREIDSKPLATYTNILPGEYTFYVMGSNNDGVWSSHPASLSIIIHPPWWKTMLFRILMVLTIILLTLGLYLLRVRTLVTQKRTLEKSVQKRTTELSAMNMELLERQEEITLQNEELSSHRLNLEKRVAERTSELLEAKRRAEESERLKSAFLANMSHEIRTPMNAIVGFAALMEDEHLQMNEKRRYSKIIRRNSESLLTLINDIIDVSIIEADQLVLNKNYFDLDEILSELFEYYQNSTEKPIEFKLHIPDGKQRTILYNDSVRFRQIMNNLLNNAAKYTSRGKIDFGYTIKDSSIEFFVKDTGMGINKKDQEKVFDYFHKVEPTINTFHQGTGIGLSITKSLVEAMGGQIWLESELEKGSVFYFNLPFTAIDLEVKRTEMLSKNKFLQLQHYEIVVVEDEQFNYELFAQILKPTKAKTTWLKNGEEAVRCIESMKDLEHCIVLMDIKMPVMNGIEATRIIRQKNPELPVIAVTAYAQVGDKERILKTGFNDYLSKPVNASELIEKLERYVK